MNTINLEWSPIYYGYTHLGKVSTTKPRVTVIDYGTKGAELVLWSVGCGFSPEHRDYPSLAAAKRAGERWLKSSAIQNSSEDQETIARAKTLYESVTKGKTLTGDTARLALHLGNLLNLVG